MEADNPVVETRADKKRKAQRLWASIGATIILLGAAGFGIMQMSTPHPTASTTTVSEPVDAFQPDPYYSGSPDGGFWSWLSKMMPNKGETALRAQDYKQAETLQDWLIKFGYLVFLGGSGLFIYAQMTRRKFMEFDKLGVLITDARKRESMSAKFIPWGCLEKIEVLGFDLKRDIVAEGADATAAESSKAHLLFHVDDGNIIKIRWRDVVRCVEPGPFINALKTYAPNACPQFEALAGDAHQVDNNTYTQLWFRYYSTGSERKRTTHLTEGDTLQEDRYEVLGQIGGGGQGTAYLAKDRDAADVANTEVVLKEYIMPVHRGQQVLQQTVQKLEQEAAILGKIDHIHIVKLLGSFVEDHRGYLVMEYVHGKSLKEIVSQQGPQPEAVVMDLARQICDVLSYLHCQDPIIVHRDLTPDNLMFQEDGRVKLVDFNVAHQLESAATATVVGKHCYIPPEQFRGRPTPQSDIYAFGCTLHYLLTGLEPEPLTPSKPKNFNAAVSQELNDIIARATMLDGTKRFASVAEMHAALNECPSGKIVVSRKENVTA